MAVMPFEACSTRKPASSSIVDTLSRVHLSWSATSTLMRSRPLTGA
jgi:hypothetical protein